MDDFLEHLGQAAGKTASLAQAVAAVLTSFVISLLVLRAFYAGARGSARNTQKARIIHGSRAVFAFLLSTMFFVGHSLAQDEKKYNKDDGGVRVEFEAKLKVPLAEITSVWDWLQARYADCSWLDGEKHVFTATFGDEDFTDTYFDRPDLGLLAEKSGVRHRVRVVHSGSAINKDGRELLQIKLNRGDETGLARSEIKFKASPGKSPVTLDETHPMIGLVAKNQREDFKAALRALGFDPYVMRPVLTLKQRRQRVYVSDQNGAFATITLDLCATRSWGANLRWAECELELDENRYTAATEADRKEMKRVIGIIQKDLQDAFPSIVQDQTPKYNTSFAAIEAATWAPVGQLIKWNIREDRFLATTRILGALLCGAFLYGGVIWLRRTRRNNAVRTAN